MKVTVIGRPTQVVERQHVVAWLYAEYQPSIEMIVRRLHRVGTVGVNGRAYEAAD